MSEFNTSLIFPLSGESFTCSVGSNAVVTNARSAGIMYLTGIFNGSTVGSLQLTINTVSVSFPIGAYSGVISSSNGVVNLLSNAIKPELTGGIQDRSNHAYLPFKKGDNITLASSGGGTSGILSLLYFS